LSAGFATSILAALSISALAFSTITFPAARPATYQKP
jgi:hypothetical protein